MSYKEFECPNCGGQLNRMDSNIAFCPYCGTKLERQKEHIKDYIGRALDEIKAGQYEASQHTVDQALRHHPEDSELNLIKAVLSHDNAYLDHVSENEVSSEVMEVCVDRVAELKKENKGYKPNPSDQDQMREYHKRKQKMVAENEEGRVILVVAIVFLLTGIVMIPFIITAVIGGVLCILGIVLAIVAIRKM